MLWPIILAILQHMSFAKPLCFAYTILKYNYALKSVTSSYVAIHHVHVLSLNLNFENLLELLKITQGGGGSKNFWTGIWGGQF